MRISDWSSDVCSSDLTAAGPSAERTAGYVMPTPWEANLDPSDNVDFYADFGEPTSEGTAPVLTAGEIIASFTVIPTAAATAAGLLIGDTGQYAPSEENGDRAVKMWLSIDTEKRDNFEFGHADGQRGRRSWREGGG